MSGPYGTFDFEGTEVCVERTARGETYWFAGKQFPNFIEARKADIRVNGAKFPQCEVMP